MPPLVRYGIVLTLYLYTTTNHYHPHVILHFAHPTFPRSHLPIPYTTSHNINIYPLFHTHTHNPLHNIYFLPEPHIFPHDPIYIQPRLPIFQLISILPMCPLLCYIIYTPNGASQPTGLIFFLYRFIIFFIFFQ